MKVNWNVRRIFPHAEHIEEYEEIYGEEGIHYTWVPADSDFQRIYVGKGEWTAKTFGDAKQMAIEFSNSVS